jgi:hypothetical protein
MNCNIQKARNYSTSTDGSAIYASKRLLYTVIYVPIRIKMTLKYVVAKELAAIAGENI